MFTPDGNFSFIVDSYIIGQTMMRNSSQIMLLFNPNIRLVQHTISVLANE